MSEQTSYRTILRSTSIIGGAQVANIATGIVKMKAAALLLGPAGVGLIGLYMNLVQIAAAVAAMGLGNVGTRQIATAQAVGGGAAVGRARRSLFWLTLILAICGGIVFWLLSGWIARVVLKDALRSTDIAWLSLAVVLTVAASSQAALLTGLRRLGDLAWVMIGAGAAGASLGIGALWLWGTHGIVALILAAPIATFLLGHVFVARLDRPQGATPTLPQMARDWGDMIRLGSAFMISGLVAVLGQLVVRTLVQRELGTEALGQFQASWTIGMIYLGFVLGAMGTDYYPRLTAVISDPVAAARLVNEQTEVALMLCAPVLLAMLGLAPWVIRVLYSAEFAPAAEILRWQILGDILKVISWPLGFLLLARGAGKTFVLTETLGMGVFVLVTLIGLPRLGVAATGVAFLAMYVVYLPLVWWLGGRIVSLRWSRAVIRQGLGLMIAAALVVALSYHDTIMGALLGSGLAVVYGLRSLVLLVRQGALPRLAHRFPARINSKNDDKGGRLE